MLSINNQKQELLNDIKLILDDCILSKYGWPVNKIVEKIIEQLTFISSFSDMENINCVKILFQGVQDDIQIINYVSNIKINDLCNILDNCGLYFKEEAQYKTLYQAAKAINLNNWDRIDRIKSVQIKNAYLNWFFICSLNGFCCPAVATNAARACRNINVTFKIIIKLVYKLRESYSININNCKKCVCGRHEHHNNLTQIHNMFSLKYNNIMAKYGDAVGAISYCQGQLSVVTEEGEPSMLLQKILKEFPKLWLDVAQIEEFDPFKCRLEYENQNVIIFDRLLHKCDIDLGLLIATSTWSVRGWTAQEAMLASRLYVASNDGIKYIDNKVYLTLIKCGVLWDKINMSTQKWCAIMACREWRYLHIDYPLNVKMWTKDNTINSMLDVCRLYPKVASYMLISGNSHLETPINLSWIGDICGELIHPSYIDKMPIIKLTSVGIMIEGNIINKNYSNNLISDLHIYTQLGCFIIQITFSNTSKMIAHKIMSFGICDQYCVKNNNKIYIGFDNSFLIN